MSSATYEKDFYAWLQETIDLVKAGRLEELDRDILIDELESMGKRDRRELMSRLVILITHLLKWAYQPENRSSGWIGSIAEQRLQILGQLEDSPSLRTLVPETLASAYPKAVSLAAKETGLPPGHFPTLCPYPPESLLDEDFFPSP
ncbi:MAG: DUF29 domain-containing protein [Bdellovibrio bacteriovorus]